MSTSGSARRSLPLNTLTLDDVSQALGVQQVFEASHLLLQLAHQAVVGVLVDHGVAADLLGAVSVPAITSIVNFTIKNKIKVCEAEGSKDEPSKATDTQELWLLKKFPAV